MIGYPVVTTKSYDVTCRYSEGQEVYIYNGKFTTNPGPPCPSPNNFEPIAIVKTAPCSNSPELELFFVGDKWTIGDYERFKILDEISSQQKNNSKIVVLSPEVWDKMRKYCQNVVDPSVKVADKHVGCVYGLLIYVSSAAGEKIQVF